MLTEIQGMDVSTEISLLEYGLLMGRNEHCEEDEYVFIHRHSTMLDRYSLSYLSISDIMELWTLGNWSKPEEVMKFSGLEKMPTKEWIRDNPFDAVEMMYLYWGPAEVFGMDYGEGLTLKEVNEHLPEDHQIDTDF